ncbi:DNA-binding transcriptional LysR family regulator [Kutzneria viridogrisea]|uniref:DNA-binding transcriptional LysR family regulator n=1 Tax=Kutzneria viridogrisea TaxID=47990 RepID=A0ABR6BAA6_9PSEU|nr:DNA-binding transcriptional LysR family regulator [Kutzneria viridogrisea]
MLAEHYPRVELRISEYEPHEAFAALLADDVDLALTYDYDLAPATTDPPSAQVCYGQRGGALPPRRLTR